MYKILIAGLMLLSTASAYAQNIPTATTAPAAATPIKLPDYLNLLDTPRNFVRTYAAAKPITDSAQLNMTALVEDVLVSTQYMDGLGRPVQVVTKQTSPAKKDNVVPVWYDEYGRSPISYLPFTASTNDGRYKHNAFALDSAFYKTHFPNEQIIYSRTNYDGSPLNITRKTMAQGNSWGGAGVGISFTSRANTVADSVVLWTIPINSEDDEPVKYGVYSPGSLAVQEVTDERGIKAVQYVNNLGQTVLTKTQLASSPASGHAGWVCTYNVYDEAGNLRMVIPPKAVEALNTGAINWNIPTNGTINSNLCFNYFYDARGRVTMKRVPGKGKTYIAYDLYDRPVMSQDPFLRQTNQWNFVLYDAQSRPTKTGLITTSDIKDTVLARAARSLAYPTLAGSYTIHSENYYDDYTWVAGSGTTLTSALETTNINSTNFTTAYNTSPNYPQEIISSQRIRGAVTGSRKLELKTSNYLFTLNIYDGNGRSIQTKQINQTGGKDVATVQYSFVGRVLRSHLAHQKNGTNAQSHTILTKSNYDHAGRLTNIIKSIDGKPDKTISQYIYNELGQVQSKLIGTAVETQIYTYNIRGWLQGINESYITNAADSNAAWFGEIMRYNTGFNNVQLNGNIAGVQWKAAGDNIARAYGFAYDNANRLQSANFSQQNTGSTAWTKDKTDYTSDGLTYDINGNILTMRQRGLKIGSSTTIDSLTYLYTANSNQLLKVTDGIADNSPMGDFKDTVLAGNDYTYDINGNITKDNNRHMHTTANNAGAVFNFLDKADSIVIAGKTSTNYYYDAGGTLLRKQINNYTGSGPVVKNYQYIAGFVYLNDTLQYAMTEEGKIRNSRKKMTTTGAFYYAFEYEYYLKDHLGNVRTVLTEGRDTTTYAATMEPSRQALEDSLFKNEYTPVNTTAFKTAIPTFDSDPTNTKVVKLNVTGNKTGPALVLKVMKGDKVQVNSFAFYNTPVQQPQQGVNLLNDIVSALAGGVINSSSGKFAISSASDISNLLNPNITNFLNNRTYNNALPKGYLNYILVDEQFNYVSSNSGVVQVAAGSSKQPLVAPLQNIGKNGYLYVYVSNESPQDVFFDDITVTHTTGPLQQEQSFYPYGLQMSAISSKALLKTTDPYKYNAGSELEEELGYYNTFFRKYDAQIGRFTGVDIRSEESTEMSVYNFGANNPVMYNDPFGDKYTHMDGHGNKWHGRDLLAGTAAEGIQYRQGNGFDGFDDMGSGGTVGPFGGFWYNFLSNAEFGRTYVNTPSGTGTAFNFKYGNESGSGNFVTNTDYGESFFYEQQGENYSLISSNIAVDFNRGGWLDGIQMALDGIGMTEFPLVSQAAELISAGISFGRGDISGGMIGLGSMIPIGGKIFEGMKIARTAAKIGRETHEALKLRVLAKGWGAEVTMIGKNGRKYRPDVITPSGNFLELKPNTISGRLKGWYQSNTYKKQLGIHGRVIYYNP